MLHGLNMRGCHAFNIYWLVRTLIFVRVERIKGLFFPHCTCKRIAIKRNPSCPVPMQEKYRSGFPPLDKMKGCLWMSIVPIYRTSFVHTGDVCFINAFKSYVFLLCLSGNLGCSGYTMVILWHALDPS